MGFADDVAAVITAETARELEIKANDSLNGANLWMQDNGLKLAVPKTGGPGHGQETLCAATTRVGGTKNKVEQVHYASWCPSG